MQARLGIHKVRHGFSTICPLYHHRGLVLDVGAQCLFKLSRPRSTVWARHTKIRCMLKLSLQLSGRKGDRSLAMICTQR